MVRYALAFLAGNLLVHCLAGGASQVLLVLLSAALLLALLPRWRWLLAFAAGAILCWMAVNDRLQQRWSLEQHDQRQRFAVVVDELPRSTAWGGTLVEARVHRWHGVSAPSRVRLTFPPWLTAPEPGERWMVTGSLRAPYGIASPGAFDAERYAALHGIDAQVQVEAAVRLGAQRWSLSRLRAHLVSRVQAVLGTEQSALLVALVAGDRRGLSDAHWQVLQRTGTGHLMAISGMHVGMVAAAGGALAWLLTWCLPGLCFRMARAQWAALSGWLCALVYAGMAGFALPTVRALLMLALLLLMLLLRRSLRPADSLSLVLMLVLGVDPLATLGASFWLSFAAVAMLLHIVSATHSLGWWRGLLAVQWRMPLLMAPLSGLMFGHVSLIAPLANLVAVPMVTLLVLPLALSGLLLQLLIAWPGVLQLAASLLDALFMLLANMSDWSQAARYPATRPWPLTACLIAGLAGVVLPLAWRMRLIMALLLLPWCLYQPDRPEPGHWRLTVLDVGQGVAAVVETHDGVLLYGSGSAWQEGASEAQRVLLPWLRQRGWDAIDWMVIANAGRQHAGGVADLLTSMPVNRAMGSGLEDHPQTPLEQCRRGMGDWLSGVRLNVLHPRPGLPYLGNDSSCVLEVVGENGRLWLLGDVGGLVERRLVLDQGDASVDVLLAARRGSRHASSQQLVDAVRPSVVIFNVAYHNRFALPDAGVVERFGQAGAETVATGAAGTVTVTGSRGEWVVENNRDDRRRWWRHRPE